MAMSSGDAAHPLSYWAVLAGTALSGLSLRWRETTRLWGERVNAEKELLLHKQISVLHQQHAGNRAKRNKVSFQEGSGLNTGFHRAGQGAEQLVPTDFFSFHSDVETGKDLVLSISSLK